MGAADFDDTIELDGLCRQFVSEMGHSRQQVVDDTFCCCDVHRGRECVVGRLTPVDVVVGVDRVLGADLAPCYLDRTVCDDLIGVHIGLGSAAGLPDHERKMIVEPTIDDFLSHPAD